MKIPLFDIDWTLIEGGNKAHDDAHNRAIQEMCGSSTASKYEIDPNGMTDIQIIREVAKLHDIPLPQIEAQMPTVVEHMSAYYQLHEDEGKCVVLPGVKELLSTLKELDVKMGLLTGNVESIGWKKVARAGLADFFSFGAFGDLSYVRADLVPIARNRAIQHYGEELALNDFVIVGDSPLDIACAKANEIGVIAVASGSVGKDVLGELQPEFLVSSLQEKDAVLSFLKGA